MKALEKDDYLYDPPSWKVCPGCGGKGYIYDKRIHDDRYDNTCGMCGGKGCVPIRYKPGEWLAAGGILTDDTPVWIWIVDDFGNDNWELFRYTQRDEKFDKVIIATSAGKPGE